MYNGTCVYRPTEVVCAGVVVWKEDGAFTVGAEWF